MNEYSLAKVQLYNYLLYNELWLYQYMLHICPLFLVKKDLLEVVL